MRKATFAMLVALSGTILATPAAAEWHEATSRHFIIYSEQNVGELQAYTKRLETFDAVVRKMLVMRDPEPNAATRLTVYVVNSVDDVQRLMHDSSGTVGGFYNAQAEGSFAIVPRNGTEGGANALKADTIFFHEYTHHMMLQGLDKYYPHWLVEGYAEFLGTVKFNPNGTIGLGKAPSHRMYELALGTKLTYDRLLSNIPISSSDPTSTSVYGRSWIMTHYFILSGERQGQLTKYLDAINEGKSGTDAAQIAFGGVKKLNGELESYYRRPALPYVTFPASGFKVPDAVVRALSPGDNAIMPLRMQSKSGVDTAQAKRVVDDERRVASQYPHDVLVQTSLAEAELDTLHYAEAIAAADRALALNPKSSEAMIFKGRALSENPARKADATTFKQARLLFAAANKLDTEDPEPLKYFYESFRRQGMMPTANASEGLHYAAALVPQDMDLRLISVRQYLRDGKVKEARARLLPLSGFRDAGESSNKAQQMIAKLDANDLPGARAIIEEMFKKYEEAEAKARAKAAGK